MPCGSSCGPWRSPGACADLARGRYGGSELHSVAAVVGGVGAQEVTKVLLRQFVPAAGTFVFNGVTRKSGVCVM